MQSHLNDIVASTFSIAETYTVACGHLSRVNTINKHNKSRNWRNIPGSFKANSVSHGACRVGGALSFITALNRHRSSTAL